MPELPEVETTCRGIAPHLLGQTLRGAVVRQPRLRWPVPPLDRLLRGQRVQGVERRAKYILLRLANGSLIIHLGMSGSLRICPAALAPRPHDHIDILFAEECLRLHDPRRFGAFADRDYRIDKAIECFGNQFAIHFPFEEREAGRPRLTSSLHAEMEAAGASFGQAFGWERLVWGSDSPVCTQGGPIASWVAATHALVAGASADEKAALFGPD